MILSRLAIAWLVLSLLLIFASIAQGWVVSP